VSKPLTETGQNPPFATLVDYQKTRTPLIKGSAVHGEFSMKLQGQTTASYNCIHHDSVNEAPTLNVKLDKIGQRNNRL